ncbi:MAG: hypothetical protein U5J98_03120 [Halobacteriales archaeon]|nr:hypothetical protein [Halobacteriales archaeon]
MSQEGQVGADVYEVYCRECDWRADNPVDLKGTANLLAGRHISRSGHVVALKTIEADDGELRRGGRSVSFEILRPAGAEPASVEVRRCGPVDCAVESP